MLLPAVAGNLKNSVSLYFKNVSRKPNSNVQIVNKKKIILRLNIRLSTNFFRIQDSGMT